MTFESELRKRVLQSENGKRGSEKKLQIGHWNEIDSSKFKTRFFGMENIFWLNFGGQK